MLDTCVAILVLVLIGFLGTRRGLLSEDFSKKASWLVMNVFLPASIFNSITDGIGQLSVRQLPHILLMMTLFIAVSYVVSRLLAQLLSRRTEDPALLELSISAMNTLLVGLPILQGVYGSMAVLYTGMSNLPFNFFLYTYGVWRLSSTGPEHQGGIHLRSMFTLCLGATVLGLLFFCFGIPVPGIAKRFLSFSAGATIPLSTVIIGITMGKEDIRAAFRDRRVYVVCLVRLIVIPLLVWLAMRPLTADVLLLKTCVVLAACPTAVVVPILALQHGHEPTLGSNSVIVSTILGLVTMPAIILLMG